MQFAKNAVAKLRIIWKNKEFDGLNLSNIDLERYELQNKVFRKCILKGCNLMNANLHNTQFISCDLTEADLTGVKVNDGTSFKKSNLTRVIGLTKDIISGSYRDMTGMKLIELDLTGFDFTTKTLTYVDFSRSTLTDAICSYALDNTNFTGAIGISNTTFKHAKQLSNVMFGNLTGIDFYKIDLVYCNFTDAILTDVNFGLVEFRERADIMIKSFVGTTLNNCTFHKNIQYLNFSNATLNNCTFHKNLQYLNFSNATLNNCSFRNIHDLNFSNATLNKCSFRNITLQYVKFSGANLREIDLYDAILYHIDMKKANLIDANLENADLTNVIFVEADLIGANFTKSMCRNIDFSYADLTRSNFTGVKYSNAKFTDSICVGIQLREKSTESTNDYPAELIKGESEQIAKHPFPEMLRNKVKGTETIYNNEATKKADAYQIHRVFGEFLKAKMPKYLNTMKEILKKDLHYSISNMKKIYSDLASSLEKKYIEPTYAVVPLNGQPETMQFLIDERIIKGNNIIGYKSTYDNAKITPIYLEIKNRNGKVTNIIYKGYRIENSVKGLTYRMNSIMNRFSRTDINTQENRNAIGSMGEFLTSLPPSLDEFKTTYLVEFINSTFYSYGNLSLGCQSCVQGILERVFEIFTNTIRVSCINDICGDDISEIASAFDIELENKRDTIQEDTINPIVMDWFESIEDDTKIGPNSKDTSDTIEQDRLLSFLKFVKTALRKVTIHYRASLIGYDASIDINNYMIKHRAYICGAQSGGKRRHKRTRKIHRK
jgi:uncharacterized protein YjbI with pentapeptide repeats